jgi:hypothetical protein
MISADGRLMMSEKVAGVRRLLADLPGRIVRGVPWANVEPAGLGVGSARAEELDEREARERHEREVWRKQDDEQPR